MESNSESIKQVSPSGRLTLEKADALKDELLVALKMSSKVLLNLAHVEDADLTLVQILYAARREAIQTGRHFELTGKLPDRIVKMLITGGFVKVAANDAREIEAGLHNFPSEA
jgi:anti-anti-sigma regulatory factor